MNSNQARQVTELLEGYCHLKEYQFKMGLAYTPSTKDAMRKMKQLHTSCVTEVSASLQFHYLGTHYVKPSRYQKTPIKQGTALHLKYATAQELHTKGPHSRSKAAIVYGSFNTHFIL
jgi:hypothetical protein